MIRIAKQGDLPSIVAICNETIAVRCTGDTLPVTVRERLPWFAEHTPQETSRTSGICALGFPSRRGWLRRH
jgi:L-amino acid N-acyltransferase YncA